MQTQVNLKVNDEVFDKAVTEIITAKIKECIRSSAQKEITQEIVDKTLSDVQERTIGQYFEKDFYGGYKMTGGFRRLVADRIDSLVFETVKEYTSSDGFRQELGAIVDASVKGYLEKFLNREELEAIIKKSLTDKIGELASEKFREMYSSM